MCSPVLTTEPPAAKEEGAPGSWSPSPWPSQASCSPPPPSEQTPGNPLINFLPEEEGPIGAPDLGLPSLPWPRVSIDGLQMPAAPESQNDFPVSKDSPSQLPPPWRDRTNEVFKDDEEPEGRRAPHLPPRPSPTLPPLFLVGSTHSSPSPDVTELWTGGTVAWEPALEGGLGPVESYCPRPLGTAPPTATETLRPSRWLPAWLKLSPPRTRWLSGTLAGKQETGASAPTAAAEVPQCGTCSVWTHGTSSCCGPSIVSLGLPSHLRTGPAGPSPASAGTPLPGGRHSVVLPTSLPTAASGLHPGAPAQASQCSAPCGSSVQRCLMKCVNTQTGLPEEDSDQCGHEAWPESSQPCGTEDCEPVEPHRESPDPRISAETVSGTPSFGFCETLHLLDGCQLPTIHTSAAAHALCPAMVPPPEAISGSPPTADVARMHRPTDRPQCPQRAVEKLLPPAP
nr:A disintegrin and metalloproteinase with thrombospondin motifs 7-like [Macaca nemestrina]